MGRREVMDCNSTYPSVWELLGDIDNINSDKIREFVKGGHASMNEIETEHHTWKSNILN